MLAGSTGGRFTVCLFVYVHGGFSSGEVMRMASAVCDTRSDVHTYHRCGIARCVFTMCSHLGLLRCPEGR
jgi:hypothetical protein